MIEVIKQTNLRLIIKSIIYRIIVLFITYYFTYRLRGSHKEAIYLSFSIEIIQFIWYIFYEKLWNNIEWGMHTDTKEIWYNFPLVHLQQFK
jgi:uncharacterized membrane protein